MIILVRLHHKGSAYCHIVVEGELGRAKDFESSSDVSVGPFLGVEKQIVFLKLLHQLTSDVVLICYKFFIFFQILLRVIVISQALSFKLKVYGGKLFHVHSHFLGRRVINLKNIHFEACLMSDFGLKRYFRVWRHLKLKNIFYPQIKFTHFILVLCEVKIQIISFLQLIFLVIG